jgi:FkbM family methyltransferase
MQFSEHDLLIRYPFQEHQPVLVDVGAHHGTFARRFAQQGWQVVAFEPEPKNRAHCERNLASFEQARCIPSAVSDVAGQRVPFYVSEEHYGIHSLQPFHETHHPTLEVETVRLDTVLAALHIPAVSLLKTDIEGADFLALKSFDFERYQPELVMVEFMDDRSQANFGYTHHDMVAYMQARGYTAFVSEWAPIKAYAREGESSEPHTWLQCVPYPLGHVPAWGNIMFVPHAQATRFEDTLRSYLADLQRTRRQARLQQRIIQPAKRQVKQWLPQTSMFWYSYARIRDALMRRM